MGLIPIADGQNIYIMQETGKPRRRTPRQTIDIGRGWRVIIEVKNSKFSPYWAEQEFLLSAQHYRDATFQAIEFCKRKKWLIRNVLTCQET